MSRVKTTMARAAAAPPAIGTNKPASDSMAECAAPTTACGMAKMDMETPLAIHRTKDARRRTTTLQVVPGWWVRTVAPAVARPGHVREWLRLPRRQIAAGANEGA